MKSTKQSLWFSVRCWPVYAIAGIVAILGSTVAQDLDPASGSTGVFLLMPVFGAVMGLVMGAVKGRMDLTLPVILLVCHGVLFPLSIWLRYENPMLVDQGAICWFVVIMLVLPAVLCLLCKGIAALLAKGFRCWRQRKSA